MSQHVDLLIGAIIILQAGGFRLPFISVGGAVLLFTLPCTLLVRKTSKFLCCQILLITIYFIPTEIAHQDKTESLACKVILLLSTDLTVIALGKPILYTL